MSAVEILSAARAYAENPAHIVKDPRDIFEDAQGRPVLSEGAVRGCLLGLTRIGARLADYPGGMTEAMRCVREAAVIVLGDRPRSTPTLETLVTAMGHDAVRRALDTAATRACDMRTNVTKEDR